VQLSTLLHDVQMRLLRMLLAVQLLRQPERRAHNSLNPARPPIFAPTAARSTFVSGELDFVFCCPMYKDCGWALAACLCCGPCNLASLLEAASLGNRWVWLPHLCGNPVCAVPMARLTVLHKYKIVEDPRDTHAIFTGPCGCCFLCCCQWSMMQIANQIAEEEDMTCA
jgi:hypothetical protein